MCHVVGADLHARLLQTAVVGGEVAVADGSPQAVCLQYLRAVEPRVEAPLSQAEKQLVGLLHQALLLFLLLLLGLGTAAPGLRGVDAVLLAQVDQAGNGELMA